MKKAIVTGANGFIGSALLKELTSHEIEIIAVVRSKKSDIQNICHLPGVSIIYCDMNEIQNLPVIVPDRDIDVWFHLAWQGSFGEERGCYEMQMNNVRNALYAADTAAVMGVKRFAGAGTLAEKDVLYYHPMDGAMPDPVSFYGIAKLTAHFMTKTECTKLGMEHVWCYLPNTYAAGSTVNNFAMMCARLLLSGARASFTQGEQMYDFMYVTDTARAFYYAAEKGRVNASYYLGSGQQRKLKEYIAVIRDAVDSGIELHLGDIPFHGNPLPEEAFNGQKLARDTGFQPEISFEEGIKRTVAWLRETEG